MSDEHSPEQGKASGPADEEADTVAETSSSASPSESAGAAAPYKGDPRVVLAKGRARPAWAGHPNVHEGAIERVDGTPADGDEIDVLDVGGRFVGRGVFCAGDSPVRVRILRNTRGPIDAAFLGRRVRQAVSLRRDVLALDAVTDAWRVIHGDGSIPQERVIRCSELQIRP